MNEWMDGIVLAFIDQLVLQSKRVVWLGEDVRRNSFFYREFLQ